MLSIVKTDGFILRYRVGTSLSIYYDILYAFILKVQQKFLKPRPVSFDRISGATININKYIYKN